MCRSLGNRRSLWEILQAGFAGAAAIDCTLAEEWIHRPASRGEGSCIGLVRTKANAAPWDLLVIPECRDERQVWPSVDIQSLSESLRVPALDACVRKRPEPFTVAAAVRSDRSQRLSAESAPSIPLISNFAVSSSINDAGDRVRPRK